VEVSSGRQSLEERLDLGGRSLRIHAARGAIINSGFKIGLAGIGFLQRVAVAAFLTREQFGIWGVILTTVLTLSWLKEVGIADKFVQQSEVDQEAAYQKAFTVELCLSLAFFALLCAVLPLYAIAYGRAEIILPGIVLAVAVPLTAFESPIWIAYRRMQFVRQRTLSAVDPLVSIAVTITLAALGAGVWALVIGVVSGSAVGALVATLTSPYRPRWRFERQAIREYATFSWPIFGLQASNLVIVQGMVLVSAHSVGIAGVGAIALASTISILSERVDEIVSETIYPAVCAVADQTELLYEAFVSSNRLAIMWGMPFGVAVGLFAGDLVNFGYGDRWHSAIGVIAGIGVLAGFRQIGFNWQMFMRATNRTRPLFTSGLVNVASFFVLLAPAILLFGLTGYIVGNAAALVVQLLMRGYYLRQLFPQFRLTSYILRALLPTAPGAAIVLLLRTVSSGERTLPLALAELVGFALVTAATTWLVERDLIVEMLGYLRGEGGGLRARQA
jgi:O-antigen/teichoic acid export membrane protein